VMKAVLFPKSIFELNLPPYPAVREKKVRKG
jgi:hypothetical protein